MLVNAFPQDAAHTEMITEEITTSGMWTVPEGIYEIFVQVFGGGGGGGKYTTSNDGGGGGGGGSGYMEYGVFAVTPGTTYAITIGNGGASSTQGGTTSFATLLSAIGGYYGYGAHGGNGGSGGGKGGTASSLYTNHHGMAQYGGGGGGTYSYSSDTTIAKTTGGTLGGAGYQTGGLTISKYGGAAEEDGTEAWIIYMRPEFAKYRGKAGSVKSGGGGLGGNGGINGGGGGGYCADGGNGSNSSATGSSTADSFGGGGGWMGGTGGDGINYGGGGGGGGYGTVALAQTGLGSKGGKGGLGYGAGGGGGTYDYAGGTGAPGICVIKYYK